MPNYDDEQKRRRARELSNLNVPTDKRGGLLYPGYDKMAPAGDVLGILKGAGWNPRDKTSSGGQLWKTPAFYDYMQPRAEEAAIAQPPVAPAPPAGPTMSSPKIATREAGPRGMYGFNVPEGDIRPEGADVARDWGRASTDSNALAQPGVALPPLSREQVWPGGVSGKDARRTMPRGLGEMDPAKDAEGNVRYTSTGQPMSPHAAKLDHAVRLMAQQAYGLDLGEGEGRQIFDVFRHAAGGSMKGGAALMQQFFRDTTMQNMEAARNAPPPDSRGVTAWEKINTERELNGLPRIPFPGNGEQLAPQPDKAPPRPPGPPVPLTQQNEMWGQLTGIADKIAPEGITDPTQITANLLRELPALERYPGLKERVADMLYDRLRPMMESKDQETRKYLEGGMKTGAFPISGLFERFGTLVGKNPFTLKHPEMEPWNKLMGVLQKLRGKEYRTAG